MKKFTSLLLCIVFITVLSSPALAQPGTHTVVKGESVWSIAVKYQMGISELMQANPQIKNSSMITVGQKINVPNIDDLKALEAEVVRLVNVERRKKGLHELKHNWELSRVARIKSQDFIKRNYFSHQSPTYGSPFDMMKQFGIKYMAAAENIAYGQKTPAAVMQGWMNSTGHRNNILSSSYYEIGVGAAKKADGTLYWTQMFIKAR